MSVNISSGQFAEADLVDRISKILLESGIEPRSLNLELTETAVMQNPDTTSKTLRRLKVLGIGLHMDDFGTGYSSLSYLQCFPFDAIKIDRSFVAGLGSRAKNRDLIKTVVELAKNFKMQVVAEGVETEVQSAELRALGCRQGQGNLFCRPVDASTAGAMIGGNDKIGFGIRERDASSLPIPNSSGYVLQARSVEKPVTGERSLPPTREVILLAGAVT